MDSQIEQIDRKKKEIKKDRLIGRQMAGLDKIDRQKRKLDNQKRYIDRKDRSKGRYIEQLDQIEWMDRQINYRQI